MKLAKGSLWLLALLVLAMTLAISSVQSTSEAESSEVSFEEWDESLDDYDPAEEEVNSYDSQEYNQKQQQPAGPYGQLPLAPNNYVAPQRPPVQYFYQPAPQYQSNYSVTELSPTPVYQQPAPYYKPVPVPLPVSVPEQQYQANYTPPVEYAPSPAPVYQPPPPSYPQAKPEQPQVYQKPAPQPAYQPKPAPVYQPTPAPAYQPTPAPAYVPKPAPVYQPVYQAPVTQKPYPVSNYSAPAAKPVYVAPAKVANYSSQPRPQYNAAALARKYTYADLAPFSSAIGNRASYWSLSYYRTLDHQVCPKPGNYTNGPTVKDVQTAFAVAIATLGYGQQGYQGQPQHYLNTSVPTFAARHQIASYMTQNKNARMDDEGLLVEFVSGYLAERMCLTRLERQRYLPSLSKLVGASNFPQSHACSQYYSAKRQQWQTNSCHTAKYRTYDGFCNNPWHPYWGKSDVCHIRLLSPDYADGISKPRESGNGRYGLPNPRSVANAIHSDLRVDGPYNLMKMQWGQFINHDISNTALSAYDGLVDCCKSPKTRGCWPIVVPTRDPFYYKYNVTCLNFIRSGVCPTCQLGPRQQRNKNTAFLDASHVYGNNQEQAMALRAFVGGMLKTSSGRNGEQLLPVSNSQEQCFGVCYKAGDSRVNQHPALTALHVLLVRNHNRHAQALAKRHPNWNDETVYQEARRMNIAEYQMITYSEYLPIVFGPVLSSYFKLTPAGYGGHTYYDPKVDPSTWNEYTTAACRFGHSQISSVFALTTSLVSYNQPQGGYRETFNLRDWFFRPSLLAEGKTRDLLTGLLGERSQSVDQWITNDVRNYLYKGPKEHFGGDLAATNIWRGRDHGLPGYVNYIEYCFNYKIRGWKDLQMFIPTSALSQMRRQYKVVENIDLFTGGMSERHFPGADIGPTFACINGIQYYHLKFGDRYYFEHTGQAGSFTPAQMDEIRRSTLARLLCRAGHLTHVPQFAFMQGSQYNPVVNCSQVGDFNYNLF